MPSWHNQEVEGRFERLEGGRYRFTIDIGELPSGGLCRWRLDYVGIQAKHIDGLSRTTVARWPSDRLDPAPSSFRCYPGGNSGTSILCDNRGALPELPWEGEIRVPIDFTFHLEGDGERPLGPG